MPAPKKHLILCGGLSTKKKTTGWTIHDLQIGEREGMIHMDTETLSRRMVEQAPPIMHDLVHIASYVYVADQVISRGGPVKFDYGNDWHRDLQFEIPVREYEIWSSVEVREVLADALSFLSGDSYEFIFHREAPGTESSFFGFHNEMQDAFQPDRVALFSGGLDSFTGAVDTVVGQEQTIALVSHQSNPKLTKLQKGLHSLICDMSGSQRVAMHFPAMINKDKDLTHDTTQRGRSFLYAALGALIAHMFKLDKVIFFENGIISCNLPFDGQTPQARRTRSTHPKLLAYLSRLVSQLIQEKFTFENPYFLKTKTDVVKQLKELRNEIHIERTRSCADSIFRYPATHCGVCSQCIDRRFATLAAECAEYDSEMQYALNIFTDGLEKGHDRAMAAGFAGLALKLETVSDNEFTRWFVSELGDICFHMNGGSREDNIRLVAEMHRRHGRQVTEVASSQLKEHSDAICRGLLPVNCLLSMISRQEHQDVGKIRQMQQVAKQKHADPPRKRVRKKTSSLTPREHEAYTIVKGQGNTQRQAALLMGCSQANISKLLKSAELKIKAASSRSVNLSAARKLPTDRRGQISSGTYDDPIE